MPILLTGQTNSQVQIKYKSFLKDSKFCYAFYGLRHEYFLYIHLSILFLDQNRTGQGMESKPSSDIESDSEGNLKI